MKPAQSGLTPAEPSDAARLRAAAGGGDPFELVCPYEFEAPLAPGVAARLAGVEISLARILEVARAPDTSAAATSVLPTPVSVPVTKSPRIRAAPPPRRSTPA
jgi:dethiobiotin synthetase